MNKDQKQAVVDELSKELSDSEAIFAVDYRGISVPQAAELRADLREADTRFRVVKNRLTLLAADKAGTETIKEHLEGPTAIAFVKGDPALAAKTIFRLGREWEILTYKGGLMEGEVLDPDTFGEIARLPGRDQMNAQFAGIVASPLTGLVRGLGSMVQGLALQLQAMADQGLVTGETPAEEEAPKEEEEPPEEVDAPAAADDEKSSDDEAGGGEDASSDEAEDAPSDGEAESPKAEAEGDPEPEESPEESPSEEEAPAGEDAGEEAEASETTEGDAEMGEAAEEAQEGEGDDGGDDTSEDSNDDKKEDDS